MSLLEKASLIITPNATKAGKLYSVIPNTALGDMDVVRATTATRVNSLGLIENVGLNVPRIDYSNGICPSILVEPQRTNRLLNSEVVVTQTITTTGLIMAVSFYGTGTITFNGTFTGSLVGTGVNNRVSIVFTPTTGNLILTVTGSVTKGQVEQGSYLTSYIPTVATAVTRNADVISKTGISDLIGQTEGTLFVDINFNANLSNKIYFNLGTSITNYIAIIGKSNNKIGLEVLNSGVQVNISSVSTYSTNQRLKIAITYKENDFKLYVNGILEATDIIGTVPAKAEVYLGSYGTGTGQSNDIINLAQIYKVILTNTELQQLTTI